MSARTRSERKVIIVGPDDTTYVIPINAFARLYAGKGFKIVRYEDGTDYDGEGEGAATPAPQSRRQRPPADDPPKED
jgi:hypothetical protein